MQWHDMVRHNFTSREEAIEAQNSLRERWEKNSSAILQRKLDQGWVRTGPIEIKHFYLVEVLESTYTLSHPKGSVYLELMTTCEIEERKEI